MSLAREICDVDTAVSAENVVDPFLPLDRCGVLDDAACATLVARMAGRGQLDSVSVLRLCLQVLQIQRDALRPRLVDAEFVATLPPDTPGIARPTQSVIREMISSAAHEIILLGYDFTDKDLVHLIADGRSRGADAILICDRGRGGASRVLEAWPSNVPQPRLYHDRKRPGAAPYASMHAKALLIDGTDLLITSANFTFHGMHGNIEIGIRLSGDPAVEARKLFSHLVENDIVERCL